MSETVGNDKLELPFQVSVDPSARDLPSVMMGAYADMNGYIERDRAIFGSTLQAGHLLASRRDIAGTALEALRRTRQGDERTAIILGAGGCIDIPIEHIVADFDKTTVVDIHTEQTERALSRLSPRLLGKIGLVRAEISGLAMGMHHIFEQAGKEKEYGQFLNVATAMTRQLDITGPQVELGSDYTFVCSQLLMTQLSAIPFSYFSRMVGEKYGKPLTMVPGYQDEALISAINDQNTKLQTGHIKQLNQLVGSAGTVHFADTLGEIRAGQMLAMVSYDAIEAIDDNFSELREMNTWSYTVSLRQRFTVGSFSLAPHPASRS